MSYREFAKLDGDQLVYAEKYMIVGEVGVLYPSDALLRASGYKRVSLDAPEEDAPEGWHWEQTGYEETDDEIRGSWEAVADPVPSDEDEIDSYEAAEILLGGEPL